jgi:hypothetical protein
MTSKLFFEKIGNKITKKFIACNFVMACHKKNKICDSMICKCFLKKRLYDDMAFYCTSYKIGTSYIHVVILKLRII